MGHLLLTFQINVKCEQITVIFLIVHGLPNSEMIIFVVSCVSVLNRFLTFLYTQVSGEIRTPDTQSVRTTSGPLGPSDRNAISSPYIDPRQPGIHIFFPLCMWP